MTDIPPISLSMEVPVPIATAFEAFVALDRWWPREYTWSGEALQSIGMERLSGGKCYELGPNGFRLDWGELSVFEPYTRLAFSWQISPQRVPIPDAANASAVDVVFSPSAEGQTRVAVTHTGFERHGDDGQGYRDGLAAPEGWPYILGKFREATAQRTA